MAHSRLTLVVCVTDLIVHMDKNTKEVYMGTEFETTYLGSHDALKQMCDKLCKLWMQ
jgi:hypothetical protein